MKAKFIALVLSLFVVSSFLVAFAQSAEITKEVNTPDCKLAQEKISDKITSYSAAKPNHILTYQILYLKSAALAEKADVLGYDTLKLNDDLDKLDALIDTFDKNYAAFIKALTTAADSACGKEDVYAKNFVLAKNALGKVRESARNISEFYANTMREDILSLEKISG